MTNFDKIKENLTADILAKLTVRLVVINNNELYYATSTGQLYPMTSEGLDAAIKHETKFWNAPIDDKTNDTESN